MPKPPVLLWFRNDLRLHDHDALAAALRADAPLLPVYLVEDRLLGKTAYGFPKMGAHRARFLLEGLEDLRVRLQAKGSRLLLAKGNPAQTLPALAEQIGASDVYAHREPGTEEQAAEQAVAAALARAGRRLKLLWGSNSLYHAEDLPSGTDWAFLPDVYTQFRKAVEKKASVRHPLPEPERMAPLPEGLALHGPDAPSKVRNSFSMQDFGLEAPPPEPRAAIAPIGGETAGLARLRAYLWERDQLRHYKATRNGLLGEDYSSKFSPWLAQGSLSPRLIHAEVRRYEAQRIANDGTYWLIFELIWRDFFRFQAFKLGGDLFHPSGPRGNGAEKGWRLDWELFDRWRTGTTGIPFVDANMREIAATGFMSNRGRQNAASYLAHDLRQPWLLGAEYFESQLIDYDVASNYGNWAYVAGVGNDPRQGRWFNVLKQGWTYDRKGNYVRHWCPELAPLDGFSAHEPWKLSREEQRRTGVHLGSTYPTPVAKPPAFGKT